MRFSRSDAYFSIVILALVGLLAFLFVQDLHRAIVNADSRELGTIVFRKRTAMRRQASSYRWERLKNESAVYEGDTIRTASLSEAGISFDDGASLDLLENTLVTISTAGGVSEFQIHQGSLSLRGGEANASSDKARVIRMGDSIIECAPGAAVSFSQTGTSFSVDVSAGSAAITKADGEKIEIDQNSELVIDEDTGESSVIRHEFIPLEPAHYERFIHQGPGAASVPFRVALAVAGSARETRIEIARDAAFSTIEATASVSFARGETSSTPVAVPLAEGTWYWRVAGSGESSASRRLTVSVDPFIEPVLPAGNAVYTYRSVKPSIRFSWTASAVSSASILELSRDRDFSSVNVRTRVDQASTVVSSLDDGAWYWRVVPTYVQRALGPIHPSKARSFRIEQSDAMNALSPTSPREGSLVNLVEVRDSGLTLSWAPEREAARYRVSLYSQADLSTVPLFTREVDAAWLTLRSTDTDVLSVERTLFWSVSWIDDEGNVSPAFRPRRFRLADSRVALTPVFPPDGYRVADSLAGTLQFTWKGSIPERTVFEIARDSAFTDVVDEIPSNAFSAGGKPWKPGRYYWRVRTFNVDGSVFLDTAPRTLIVMEPLASPRLRSPEPLSTLTVRKGEGSSLAWGAVDGADRYRVFVYPASRASREDKPLFELGPLTGLSGSFPAGTLKDGRYAVVTQAFTDEGPLTTRNIGYRGTSEFNLKTVAPVALVSPPDGIVISGLEARSKGVTLSWSMPDEPTDLIVSLARNGTNLPVTFDWLPGVSSVTVPRLPEGRYVWGVRASKGELDISSSRPRAFTVAALPVLPPPRDGTPAEGAVFGAEFFRESRKIEFSWTPVEGASRYSFRVINPATRNAVFEREGIAGTSVVLDDFSALDRGRFLWEVSALALDETGAVIQDGKALSRSFEVSLPEIKAPVPRTDVEYYGR